MVPVTCSESPTVFFGIGPSTLAVPGSATGAEITHCANASRTAATSTSSLANRSRNSA